MLLNSRQIWNSLECIWKLWTAAATTADTIFVTALILTPMKHLYTVRQHTMRMVHMSKLSSTAQITHCTVAAPITTMLTQVQYPCIRQTTLAVPCYPPMQPAFLPQPTTVASRTTILQATTRKPAKLRNKFLAIIL